MQRHPLDPLSAEEILIISRTLRQYGTETLSVKAWKFIHAAVIPPPKLEVLNYLGIPTSIVEQDQPNASRTASRHLPERWSEVDFIDVITGTCYTARLSYVSSEEVWKVISVAPLEEGVQPTMTLEELISADEAVRKSPEIIKVAAEIGLKPEQLCADGWSIGYDSRFPRSRRVQQCVMFARFGEDDNIYAHPLDFFPILDSNTFEVVHIDYAAHRTGPSGSLSVATTAPPNLDLDAFTASNRPRILPPAQSFNYLPERLSMPIRDDVKPLHIIQPEGPSFKINELNEIEWQKWKMHVGFSAREGVAISTVTYNDNGHIRPLFYRLSLAEMVVPYGAPEHPHPRKFAFDAGEYGMGTQANDLSLGCDCLGAIQYLPGSYIGHSGEPVTLKRAICIHEEDVGVLWKHTDYRPGGRAHSVRNRRLSISMVCTPANYEYLFYWHFYQDGSVSFEVRLSGILSVYVLAPLESSAPFGTTIAPQINAHNHQHIFSVRIDPMIDGLQNSVVESDIIPLPNAPTGSSENFAGNAFISTEKTLKSEGEGGRDYDAQVDRRWKIINPNKLHYASKSPVGYAIGAKGAMINMLARNDSWAAKRATFATKALWVVKDSEDQTRMFPAGRYVPQTRESPPDSVGEWAKGDESIENTDIVLFLTIGANHIARPEDWPVMPVEKLDVMLKPVGFFTINPSLDVPGTKDERSVEVDATLKCCN